MAELVWRNDAPPKPVFSIGPDGIVALGPGVSLDEASRKFWETVSESNPLRSALAAERARSARLESERDEWRSAAIRASADFWRKELAKTVSAALSPEVKDE